MEFKYVNPKAVEHLVGRYAPISAFTLARVVEEALANANLGYERTAPGHRSLAAPDIALHLMGVADRLLSDNLNRGSRAPWEQYAGLDFDLVYHAHRGARPSTWTEVKPYFHHPQLVRPPDQRRVVFHIDHHEISGTSWKISFPVQVVMKGFPSVPDSYMGYSHGIHLLESRAEHFYIGVTGRNWLQRMSEHFNAIRSGSNKTFHAAWRKYIGQNNVNLLSELITINHSYDQIMAWEEHAVDQQMEAGTSLNMIPGGFKGMKFLHEHRLTTAPRVSIEERDNAIGAYQALNPRAGVPNLIISELWKDSRYAESVICGVEGRLSIDQVRKIRELFSAGVPLEKIVELSGARNTLQVERVTAQKTYTRIH